MEEEEKTEKTSELDLNSKIKKNIEKKIEDIVNADSIDANIDYFSKLININKNISNIEYWKNKEEDMMYRDYGEYNDGSYGRRGVPGTGRGRYRDGGSSGSYGRRGVKGTGRGRYRGEEMLDEMMYQYGNYSDGKEMYGADQDTMQSFKYMLKAFKDYYKHLKQEASTSEEVQMLEDTAREMLEM